MNNNFWEIYDLKNNININDKNKIQIAFVKKKNTVGIDIRKYYLEGNEWKSGKGTMIPPSKWNEFKSIISGINL